MPTTMTRPRYLRNLVLIVIWLCLALLSACTSQQYPDDISDQPQVSNRTSATPSQRSAQGSATPLPRIFVQIDRINDKVDLACRKFVREESDGTGNMFELHREFEPAYDELLTLYDRTSITSQYYTLVRSELNRISYGLQTTQEYSDNFANRDSRYSLPEQPVGGGRLQPFRATPRRPSRLPTPTRIDHSAFNDDQHALTIDAVQFCTGR